MLNFSFEFNGHTWFENVHVRLIDSFCCYVPGKKFPWTGTSESTLCLFSRSNLLAVTTCNTKMRQRRDAHIPCIRSLGRLNFVTWHEVVFMAPRILGWLLGFWKIYGPLVCRIQCMCLTVVMHCLYSLILNKIYQKTHIFLSVNGTFRWSHIGLISVKANVLSRIHRICVILETCIRNVCVASWRDIRVKKSRFKLVRIVIFVEETTNAYWTSILKRERKTSFWKFKSQPTNAQDY
jgi:hypothetical protein